MTISRIRSMTWPTTRRSMLLGAGALAALVGAGTATAAAHGPGPGRGGSPLFHLLRRLDLSDDQKTQIKTIVKDARPRLEPLVEQAIQARRGVFQAVAAPTFDEAAIRAASEAAARAVGDLAVERGRLASQVRAVLTAEQQTELDQRLQQLMERRGRRQHMGWRERAGDPVESL